MKSTEIRQSFLDFFVAREHQLWPSAPLVPHGDPSLLFTNAGMVQFKDYFLGIEEPQRKRAVSVQKCLRVSGKHNDLENVGPSPHHHTFFEMLGNFSFGDYFKEEAIEYGWELVTATWGLEPEHLFATVYEEDDEAYDLWLKISSLPPERVLRCGKEENFWAMGETGPCGPCSEIFVDRHPSGPKVSWEDGTDSGRYLEIWNLVFMQFERDAREAQQPLPRPSIDTGAGLERVASVLQGANSNYDTDLFRPILDAAAALAKTVYGKDPADDVSLRVIADHLRAVGFLLADGVIPSNEGRGYVLRRILRRAVRHGMRLGFDEPFLHRLVPVLGEVMGSAYPELDDTREASLGTVQAEEEKFLSTVAVVARQVQEAIEEAHREGRDTLPGETVFRFYDTFGLPLEMVREIAEEEQLRIDEEGFGKALDEQRARSRSATTDLHRQTAQLREALGVGDEDLSETEFLGYDQLRLDGVNVQRLVRLTGGRPIAATALEAGQEGVVVFDRTVFYAEAGGQVGDRGEVSWTRGRARVLDTQKDPSAVVFHQLKVLEGRLEVGRSVTMQVEEEVRLRTERNHTATHLLHAGLRERLGTGVRQAGSLVHPERLRFDFTYPQPVSQEDRQAIEELVNAWIRRAVPVSVEWRSYREAVDAGAMALFGEKYGDRVRTVEVPGFSLELCGGSHVRNTGEIGPLAITSERGVASGVRRIEALTGDRADAWRREREELLSTIETGLGVPASRAPHEIAALKERVREAERELARLRMRALTTAPTDGDEALEVAGVKVLTREVPATPSNELRILADVLRSRLGSGVVVLGSREEGRVNVVAAVTDDLTEKLDAGELAKRIGDLVGGSGGGRRDFAQAGGKDPHKLPQALRAVSAVVEEQLAGRQ